METPLLREGLGLAGLDSGFRRNDEALISPATVTPAYAGVQNAE
jgi:hypothetical protein